MGLIIICLVCAMIVAFSVGLIIGKNIQAGKEYNDINDLRALEKTFDQLGFDFSFMIERISKMSVKAQATFAYQYTQMLKSAGNRRMINTLRRYLDAVEIKMEVPKQGFFKQIGGRGI